MGSVFSMTERCVPCFDPDEKSSPDTKDASATANSSCRADQFYIDAAEVCMFDATCPAPGTTQRQSLKTSYSNFATEPSSHMAPFETPLSQINSHGQMIGHRGMAKPHKTQTNHNQDRLITVAESYGDSPTTKPLNVLSDALPHTVSDFRQMSISQPGSDEAERVTLMVFALQNVVCTDTTHIHNKTEAYVSSMSTTQRQLCFGGQERIAQLQCFLQKVRKEHSMQCMIVTQESTKTVLRLLQECTLLRHFVSRSSQNAGKVVSHVIGWDDALAKKAQHKMHLILLQLLQSASRAHAELLFVTHDKEQVEHLESIGACKTYLCKAKGMTLSDIDEIQKLYF